MGRLKELIAWARGRFTATASRTTTAMSDDAARLQAAWDAWSDETRTRGMFADKSIYSSAPCTLEELVRKYPVIAEPSRSYEQRDSNAHTESVVCEGAFLAPHDLGELTAYDIHGDVDWSRHYYERWFDAVLPDGTLVKNFVRVGETVAGVLSRLSIAPVLILHRTHEGKGNNPSDPTEGYTDCCRTWVWYMDKEETGETDGRRK